MKSIANIDLTTGLTTIPVQVRPMVKTDDVTFKMCAPDGTPVKQVYIREDNGEVVGTRADCEKSYEGTIIPKDDLKLIEDMTKIKVFEPRKTVALKDVEWFRATNTYYVQVNPKAPKAALKSFAAILAAMKKEKKGLVLKWTPRTRQEQVVLWEKNGVMLATALAFAGDCQQPDENVTAHQDIKLSAREVEVAQMLLGMLDDDGSDLLASDEDEAVAQKKALIEKYVGTGALPEKTKATAAKVAESDPMEAMLADIERMKAMKAAA